MPQISFSRISAMDSMGMDLSEYLLNQRKRSAEAAAAKVLEAEAAKNRPKQKRIAQTGFLAPMRGGNESKRMERTSRITKQANNSVRSTRAEEVAEVAAQAAKDKTIYDAMKEDFLVRGVGC